MLYKSVEKSTAMNCIISCACMLRTKVTSNTDLKY